MAREHEEHGAPPDAATGQTPQTQPQPRPSLDATLATMTGRRAFITLQLLASLVGAGSGMVVYLFLVGLRLNAIVALVLGFMFALLARQAMRSLALEWVVRQARRRPPPS
jgi:hypothetical protein